MVTYKWFEDWFDEIENYGFRSERFFSELANNTQDRAILEKWLKAAFYSARLTDETTWTLTVEEDEFGPFITLPEALVAAKGWRPGTQLEWIDQGDGTWLIKEKVE